MDHGDGDKTMGFKITIIMVIGVDVEKRLRRIRRMTYVKYFKMKTLP